MLPSSLLVTLPALGQSQGPLNNHNAAHTLLHSPGELTLQHIPGVRLLPESRAEEALRKHIPGPNPSEKFPSGHPSNTHINYIHNMPGACGWTLEDKITATNRAEPPRHDLTEL